MQLCVAYNLFQEASRNLVENNKELFFFSRFLESSFMIPIFSFGRYYVSLRIDLDRENMVYLHYVDISFGGKHHVCLPLHIDEINSQKELILVIFSIVFNKCPKLQQGLQKQ